LNALLAVIGIDFYRTKLMILEVRNGTLSRIPSHSITQLSESLPNNWKPITCPVQVYAAESAVNYMNHRQRKRGS
jgi:hypothetical protein